MEKLNGKSFDMQSFNPLLSQFLVKFLFEQNPDPTPQMSQILVFFFCTLPLCKDYGHMCQIATLLSPVTFGVAYLESNHRITLSLTL